MCVSSLRELASNVGSPDCVWSIQNRMCFTLLMAMLVGKSRDDVLWKDEWKCGTASGNMMWLLLQVTKGLAERKHVRVLCVWATLLHLHQHTDRERASAIAHKWDFAIYLVVMIAAVIDLQIVATTHPLRPLTATEHRLSWASRCSSILH